MKTWPALDIVSHGARGLEPDAAGFLNAFLDDFSPTAILDLHDQRDPDPTAWRVFFPLLRKPGTAQQNGRCRQAPSGHRSWTVSPSMRVPDEALGGALAGRAFAVRVGRVIVTPPWDVARAARAAGSHHGVRHESPERRRR